MNTWSDITYYWMQHSSQKTRYASSPLGTVFHECFTEKLSSYNGIACYRLFSLTTFVSEIKAIALEQGCPSQSANIVPQGGKGHRWHSGDTGHHMSMERDWISSVILKQDAVIFTKVYQRDKIDQSKILQPMLTKFPWEISAVLDGRDDLMMLTCTILPVTQNKFETNFYISYMYIYVRWTIIPAPLDSHLVITMLPVDIWHIPSVNGLMACGMTSCSI